MITDAQMEREIYELKRRVLEMSYISELIDYSAVSTIVGWTTFTNKQVFYRQIGNTVFVRFYISGTSNSVNTTFTLPVAATAALGPTQFIYRCVDNGGAAAVGYGTLATGGSTAILYFSPNSAAWTAGGAKLIIGQFNYEVA